MNIIGDKEVSMHVTIEYPLTMKSEDRLQATKLALKELDESLKVMRCYAGSGWEEVRQSQGLRLKVMVAANLSDDAAKFVRTCEMSLQHDPQPDSRNWSDDAVLGLVRIIQHLSRLT